MVSITQGPTLHFRREKLIVITIITIITIAITIDVEFYIIATFNVAIPF